MPVKRRGREGGAPFARRSSTDLERTLPNAPPMTSLRPIVPVLAMVAAACASPAPTHRGEHVLETELRAFQTQQMVFREQNTTPIVFDFPEDGSVTVREVTLDGWPGSAYVRCRFHYQNRTATPIVQAWVSLDVLDAQGRLVSTQSCNCILPVPMPLARGSYYSNELRAPTYDAHLEPGWSWRIRCQAVPVEDDPPLDPPVPPRTVREYPPMEIRPR